MLSTKLAERFPDDVVAYKAGKYIERISLRFAKPLSPDTTREILREVLAFESGWVVEAIHWVYGSPLAVTDVGLVRGVVTENA